MIVVDWLRCAAASGVVVLAVGAVAACSQPPAKKATPALTPTKIASNTSDPNAQARDAALAAYTGMWADYTEAARTADYKDQRLVHHATDAALGAIVQSLYRLNHDGLVIKGELRTAPTVVDSSPTNAPTRVDIRDCASDQNWLEYVAATGKPKDAVPGGHRLVTAEVTKQFDLWRVVSYQVQAEGTC